MSNLHEIFFLNELSPGKSDLCGSKIKSIMKLHFLGIRVPCGFVIDSNFYREFIHKNGIDALIDGLEKSKPIKKEKITDRLTAIRNRINDSEMEEGLEEDIHSALNQLSARSFAVRSSSNTEDSRDKSFAGLYDSFTGISGTGDVIRSIKQCWASLWSERAYSYLKANDISVQDVSMSVLVQEYIEADCSGVLFSEDPVTGNMDRIVIETVHGTAEELMQGRMRPERMYILKKNRKILQLEPIDTRFLKQKLLSRRDIKKLAGTALFIEKKYGHSVDIEWAFRKGRLFILQARPITTQLRIKPEDFQVWSNMNSGEIFPDAVTPFTWSISSRLMENIFIPIYREIDLDIRAAPVVGLFAGRIYFNLNTIKGLLSSFPFAKWIDVDRILGGHQTLEQNRNILNIPPIYTPETWIGWRKMFLMAFLFLLWLGRHGINPGVRFYKDIKSAIAKEQKKNISKLDDGELYEHHLALIKLLFGKRAVPPFIAYPAVGMVYYFLFDKFCMKIDKFGRGLTNKLLSGIGEMESAIAGHDLWRLASAAAENKAIRDIVLNADDFEEFNDNLTKSPEGIEYLERWNEFMQKHGHHARGEIDWYNKRWSERPGYILGIVQSYLKYEKKADPIEEYKQRREKRIELEIRVRSSIKNPWRKMVFKFLLKKAKRGGVIRENLKSQAIKIISLSRLTMLEMGRRMIGTDVVEQPDDVFFLGMDEFNQVWRGEMEISKANAFIKNRRKEYQESSNIKPPSIIRGTYKKDESTSEKSNYPELSILKGLGISAGNVIGKARVVKRDDEEVKVKPGEIIIAPFSDPGWTPHFIPAAGIVLDMGGLLSHGSIIAREYGIPAVANVGYATRLIKTGQLVEVDGTNGVVKILENK